MTVSKYKRLNHRFIRRINLKRIFKGWRGTLNYFKRKRILNESTDTQWKGLTLGKCFRVMREYSQHRIRAKIIID